MDALRSGTDAQTDESPARPPRFQYAAVGEGWDDAGGRTFAEGAAGDRSALRRRHVPWRVSPVPRPAADRPLHPPVVWRRPGRVDDLHALLPSRPVGGVWLRAPGNA